MGNETSDIPTHEENYTPSAYMPSPLLPTTKPKNETENETDGILGEQTLGQVLARIMARRNTGGGTGAGGLTGMGGTALGGTAGLGGMGGIMGMAAAARAAANPEKSKPKPPKMITIKVTGCDTIRNVKAKIQDMEGMLTNFHNSCI